MVLEIGRDRAVLGDMRRIDDIVIVQMGKGDGYRRIAAVFAAELLGRAVGAMGDHGGAPGEEPVTVIFR